MLLPPTPLESNHRTHSIVVSDHLTPAVRWEHSGRRRSYSGQFLAQCLTRRTTVNGGEGEDARPPEHLQKPPRERIGRGSMAGRMGAFLSHPYP